MSVYVSEIVGLPKKYVADTTFMNIFAKAITTRGEIVVKNKSKKTISYAIAKTSIIPKYTQEMFGDFIDAIKGINDINIIVCFLDAGISVKYDFGKFQRNLFSLRHPRRNNGIIYSNLSLNPVNDEADLMKLKLNFDCSKFNNYYRKASIPLSEIIKMITDERMKLLIQYARRCDNKFKNNLRCNQE